MTKLLLCDRDVGDCPGYEVMFVEYVDGNASFALTDIYRKLIQIKPSVVKLVVNEPERSLFLNLIRVGFPKLKVRKKR